ncbi:dUTP diphosphatase [Clostridium manihotivorum]|jgi:dimeric dUTPase (all-alpha-NTP-PPase superfamily)|uniref:dUTPase n=1 Tax=Clostridium manihotivorum TaxID=2320868 RepID=A0A410DN00_9CLOT|nr:dUTP diphosphatase [Clostridium manihotivorum]QAA30448.1 dUTPase [Clostridium manihotivorum]
MNLNKFFTRQKELNKTLILDPNLNDYKLRQRKFLELQIKIGALAEDTKCYKYWVEKDAKLVKASILDNYINCLSSILTIGIYEKYDEIEELIIKPNDYCLSDQFLNLFIDVNDLIISPSKDHYETLLDDYLSLGISLCFSEKEIEELFLKNNLCKLAL